MTKMAAQITKSPKLTYPVSLYKIIHFSYDKVKHANSYLKYAASIGKITSVQGTYLVSIYIYF